MKINTIISPDDIIVGLKANSKKQVLQEMAARITAPVDGLETRLVFDHLMERERLGCTSIGGGIAIPHTRCAFPENMGNKPLTQLAVLNKPIDFQSNDDHPVDIVFMLIAPDHIGGEHLTRLPLRHGCCAMKTAPPVCAVVIRWKPCGQSSIMLKFQTRPSY